MDRSIVYSGALPQTTDILNTNKFGQIGLGFALRGILGSNTVVHNLACTPTSPASLQVTVGAGAIYTLDTLDATAYSDLGLDQHQIIKQGILADSLLLSITPPGTGGFSQVYLVQAILSDIDTGAATLPYYNATNPTMPFSGPGNNGMSQYTSRTVACTIALKAGTAAATGSQTTPSPDAGYTGLYAVTVQNGQTQITSGNIVLLPTAPFFPTLPAVPNDVQISAWTYCVDTGAANAMVATLYPPITSLVPGTAILVRAVAGNTGVATLNLNGTGAQPIHRATGANLSSGDYSAGEVIAMVWDGAAWQMINFIGATSGGVVNNFNSLNIPFAVDSGSINAMTALFSPALGSLAAGQTIEVQVLNTNTGDSTITCNVLAAKGIRQNGTVLQPRALVAGQIVAMIYDGTFFQIINARWPYVAFDTSAPPGTDISMAIGDQVTVSFTNATSLPLKVATSGGFFDVTLFFTAAATGGAPPPGQSGEAGDNDLCFLPNNTEYSPSDNGFWHWVTQATDGGQPAFPYISRNTQTQFYRDTPPSGPDTGWETRHGCFVIDVFSNTQSFLFMGDKGYNYGPMIVNMKISTVTTAKMLTVTAGIAGGPSMTFARWYDTSTPWTSLGTLVLANPFRLGAFIPGYVCSGTAIIKRLG